MLRQELVGQSLQKESRSIDVNFGEWDLKFSIKFV